jgi:hypothetical protein
VRRFGGPDDPRPPLVLASRSDIDLDRQVTAPGATWLDYRLVERERMLLAMGGVGQEVRDARKRLANRACRCARMCASVCPLTGKLRCTHDDDGIARS